ncbi:hypothetical protein B0H13DRAFT_1898347 [Mycena leptocephala]|nr:hypothetical protein B0H13DRAFT_1898347 [Mycena leptocephala]
MVNGGQKLASTYLNAPTDINLSFSHLGSEEEILVSRPVPAFPQSRIGVVRELGGHLPPPSQRPHPREAFRLIDQGTQSPDNALSAMQRVFDVANTFDAEYFDHETDPIITGYLKPFTTDMEIDKAVRTIIRKMAPNVGLLAFTPKTRDGAAPECVICKLDNHLAYICPFTRATPPWWGPPDQLSHLIGGILGRPPRGGDGGGGGPPRGGGGGGNTRGNGGGGNGPGRNSGYGLGRLRLHGG